MDSKEASYYPLVTSNTPIDEEDSFNSDAVKIPQNEDQAWSKSTLCIAILSTLNIVFVSLLMLALKRAPTDAQCTEKLSLYCIHVQVPGYSDLLLELAPALVAAEYVNADFENGFNVTSIYKGPPILEREEAWERLTYKHGVEIPANELTGLNRSESDNLKHVPKNVGTGYIAVLEVFHQLHCLNIIRMYTWFLVDKYPGIPDGLSTSPLKNRMHVDHCIESLRLSLQCAADVTPVFVKLGGPTGSKADFNSHHRCRNFDKIEDWIDTHWTVN